MLGASAVSHNIPTHADNTSTNFVAGSSDYIIVLNHATLQINGEDFSAAFWIKLTEDATSTDDKTGWIGTRFGQFRQGGFWFEYTDASGDDEVIKFGTSTTGAQTLISTTTNIAHDTWYHVAATYDVSATTAKLYLNGVLEATDTSMSAPTAFSNNCYIGASNFGSKYVSSNTKDICFWKGIALSINEIKALYSNGLSVSPLTWHPDKIKGYWALSHLDQPGSGKVVDRSIAGGRNGTSTNLTKGDFATLSSPTGV